MKKCVTLQQWEMPQGGSGDGTVSLSVVAGEGLHAGESFPVFTMSVQVSPPEATTIAVTIEVGANGNVALERCGIRSPQTYLRSSAASPQVSLHLT